MIFHIPLILSLFLLLEMKADNISGKINKAASIKGIINLSNYDFDQAPIKLNGEWLFEWNQFQNEFNFNTHNTYIHVPGSWKKYSKSTFFDKDVGYCTYGIKILLPENEKEWSLYIPPIHSAYKIFINGDLYGKIGDPRMDENMIPSARVKIVNFKGSSKEVIVIIQVSNFYFGTGGIWSPILMGNTEVILKERGKNIFISSFLIGSLIIMGIYHMALFFFREKNKAPLYFAFICFLIALRESFGSEALFYELFPKINYELSLKLLYQVFPSCLIAFLLFFSDIYPQFSRDMVKLGIAVCILYIVLISFASNTFYSKYLFLISILFAVQSLYLLNIIIRAKFKLLEDRILFFGIITLIFCFFNDILYEQGFIDSYFMLPLGFFIFILCQSMILSIRFSDEFKKTELLSVQLLKSNNEILDMSLNQQKLEEGKILEEMKNRFFSNITHEFRTPLTLIISPMERLIQGSLDSDSQNRTLKIIYKSANQLLLLINQLLDLSKLDAKSMSVSFHRGNVSQFLSELLYSFKLSAEEKDIELEFLSDSPIDEIVFDADKLEKICYNLISNSLKFTPSNGKITLQLNIHNDQIKIRIIDTGLGIPNHHLPYIFQRFYQIDNSSTRTHEGTGIGLALVKELIDLLNGKIHVKSALGQGTTFYIEIPIIKIEEGDHVSFPRPSISISKFPASYSDHQENILINKKSPLILVVDDNLELLDYIRTELNSLYNVLTAKNGQEAWEICQQELPDLVISDIMMPFLNGYELCKLIKTTDNTSHIGVILLTAKAAAESKIQGLSLGANDYVPKPFHYQELHLRIKNFLSYQQNLKAYYLQNLSEFQGSSNLKDDHPFLQKLYAVIEIYLDNPKLSVATISSELAISSRTLNRKLSSIIGLNANEVIRNYRLKKGAEFLKLGCNVSEAAYKVGFESPSYFGYCFKELYNITPSEFLSKFDN